MKKKRLLILICSCAKTKNKRQNCRNTWLTQKPDNIDYFFFTGEKSGEEVDTIYLDCDDTYEGLVKKMYHLFVYIENKRLLDKYEYIMKCDDDTYVALNRIESILSEEPEIAGAYYIQRFQNEPDRPTLLGGAGYFIKSTNVPVIRKEMNINAEMGEDSEVTMSAIRAGLRITKSTLLQQGTDPFPRVNNDLVTCHWCDGVKMEMVMSGLLLGESFCDDKLLFQLSRGHNFKKKRFLYSSCVFTDENGDERGGIISGLENNIFTIRMKNEFFRVHVSKVKTISE